MELKKKLRDQREKYGFKQSEVAEILGTSQTMYARYERGANELPIRHLVKLCRLYNVSADYFLDTEPLPYYVPNKDELMFKLNIKKKEKGELENEY